MEISSSARRMPSRLRRRCARRHGATLEDSPPPSAARPVTALPVPDTPPRMPIPRGGARPPAPPWPPTRRQARASLPPVSNLRGSGATLAEARRLRQHAPVPRVASLCRRTLWRGRRRPPLLARPGPGWTCRGTCPGTRPVSYPGTCPGTCPGSRGRRVGLVRWGRRRRRMRRWWNESWRGRRRMRSGATASAFPPTCPSTSPPSPPTTQPASQAATPAARSRAGPPPPAFTPGFCWPAVSPPPTRPPGAPRGENSAPTLSAGALRLPLLCAPPPLTSSTPPRHSPPQSRPCPAPSAPPASTGPQAAAPPAHPASSRSAYSWPLSAY
mmetsp:Transcript_19616/g.63849  ORF Transcript_19616/g.63849 Transcript_19616/m.63849 type:complete len:327 (+) Transcript_19616:636-1616(+)